MTFVWRFNWRLIARKSIGRPFSSNNRLRSFRRRFQSRRIAPAALLCTFCTCILSFRLCFRLIGFFVASTLLILQKFVSAFVFVQNSIRSPTLQSGDSREGRAEECKRAGSRRFGLFPARLAPKLLLDTQKVDRLVNKTRDCVCVWKAKQQSVCSSPFLFSSSPQTKRERERERENTSRTRKRWKRIVRMFVRQFALFAVNVFPSLDSFAWFSTISGRTDDIGLENVCLNTRGARKCCWWRRLGEW